MIFDIVVLAVCLISCLVAFLRGFIREVLTIFGLVGGLVAAWALGPHFGPVVRDWLDAERGDEPRYLFDIVPYTVLADLLAYGSIFLLVVIVLSVISYMLSKSARAIGLGAVDRSLGVLFGMARAIVLLGLLYLLPYSVIDDEERAVLFGDSRTRPHIENVSAWMSDRLAEAWPAADGKTGNTVSERARETADDLAREAREKIDALEPLRLNTDLTPDTGTDEAAQPGYEDEQRQNMQDLIDDNIEGPAHE